MRRFLTALAAAGSAALLVGALGFQYIGGLQPCELCLLQRWPHGAAVAIGALALLLGLRGAAAKAAAALGAVAALTASGLGLYHTGVEQKWWAGPSACTGNADLGSISAKDLVNQIMSAPIVRCDQPSWDFLGLTMASWNAILSLLLVFIWIAAVRNRD